jgi:anti-sigma factor ChrR (cupin superfamily)
MTRDSHPADPAETAALWAAGALPPAEAAEFQEHARACAACAAELASYGPVVERLAAADHVAPPPWIRDTLLVRARAAALTPPGDEVFSPAADADWQPAGVPGVSMRILRIDRPASRLTALLRMEAGHTYPRHVHAGPEEMFVVAGDMRDGERALTAGDYQYSPPGSVHGDLTTEHGCVMLVIAPLGEMAS